MFSAGYTQKNTRPKRSVRSRTISDYSPFGVLLKERTVESAFFRTGFQGQERDDEMKGEGNSVNFKYRMHDPRVGRFFAVDPLIKKYPYYSSYSFSGNRVIDACEIEGLEPSKADGWSKEKTAGADDHQVEFWPNNNGGLDTYYKPFQIKELQEIKVTPNNAGSLIIQETGQSSNPLSGVSLSGVARGLSAPTSSMSNPWKDDIANHPEWKNTRAKVTTLEKGMETYMTTMVTLPLGGSGKLFTATVNAGTNLGGQLIANDGNWCKVDVLSVATAFGSGFLPGGSGAEVLKSSLVAGTVDASFDYSTSGGFNYIGKKNWGVFANDLGWGTLGNAGSGSFGTNPPLFRVVGTAVPTIPTIIMNTVTNNQIDPPKN